MNCTRKTLNIFYYFGSEFLDSLTDEAISSWGLRGRFPINRAESLQARATHAQPLKPQLLMSLCCAVVHFIIFVSQIPPYHCFRQNNSEQCLHRFHLALQVKSFQSDFCEKKLISN